MDKYAQADGRFIGKPGTPTGVTTEGPELQGATNLVLGALDHREVAFHPRAFREIYKFIAGRESQVLPKLCNARFERQADKPRGMRPPHELNLGRFVN